MNPDGTGYCIYCGKDTSFNPSLPMCTVCGGSCSMAERTSPVDGSGYFCHGCKKAGLFTAEHPLCDECGVLIGKP
nr:hypothetical protein [Candidatus Sigynarchaeota archaeon]